MSGGIKGNWGPYSNPAPPDEGDVVVDSAVPGLGFPNMGGIPTMTATGPVTLPGVTSSGPVAANDGLAVEGGATADSLAVSGAATVGGNPVATLDAGAGQSETYTLDNIDCTTTGDKGAIIPAKAGQFFIVSRYSVMVRTLTGNATTAPTFDLGAGVGGNGILPAATSMSTGQINVGVDSVASNNVTGMTGVANSAVHLGVHAAVIGATVLTVRFILWGYWVTA
jgi:hypothetical protein